MGNKSIKILLIHPEVSRTKYNFAGIIENECLDLEYLSAHLKNLGHIVEIFDTQVEEISAVKKIKLFDPQVVYVCGRVKQENFMLEYCAQAKKHNREILTIIGGIHSQLCRERLLKDYVDYVAATFDVFTVSDIIHHHFGIKETDLSTASGVCTKIGDKWQINPTIPFDIKKLPLPDRTYFYDHPNNYGYLDMKHAACVRTAYCCPYCCKFCCRNRMNAGKYTSRDIADVVDEIENIKAENIYIVDDDFLVNKKRLITFIELIKERNIRKKYICFGRADFIAKNEDVMTQLKEIGFTYVLVGLEAIDDSHLLDYNKKSNLANNLKAIEICQKLNINIMAMFILDLSYTPKDFRNLYRWIKKHNLRHVAVSIFLPEMGMEPYEEYKDRLITHNPSHWDYLHVVAKPDNMSVKRYYLHYYILLIRLFFKAKREGVYDFVDYKSYILSFIRNIFVKRKNDDE